MEPPVFQFVPIASSPVPGHHRKEPGSLFFTSSLQMFVCIDEISLSLFFSRLNNPCSLSFSSQERIFTCPLLDCLQYVSLLLGNPELDPALQMCPDRADKRRGITSLDCLATLLLMQPLRSLSRKLLLIL